MNTENEILVKKKFNSSNMYGSKFSKEKAKMASSSEALSKIVLVQNTFNKMVEVFLTLFYMGGGGTMFPPWSIIARQLSMDALNWLIFHDFVPFNIRKVLGRQFLKFFFKISKILAWTIFSDFDPNLIKSIMPIFLKFSKKKNSKKAFPGPF